MPPKKEQSSDAMTEASHKILLIDDDREIVSAVRTLLEGRGYQVVTASDGNAGVSAAAKENPDLVIVDMMMPKRSGFLVIEKLNQQQPRPQIIMITANEGQRHKAYAEMLGVAAYLRKPFPMEILLDEVEKVLN
jgi:DNA-binding response OmpR family regulator